MSDVVGNHDEDRFSQDAIQIAISRDFDTFSPPLDLFSNAHARLNSKAICPTFGQILRLISNYVCDRRYSEDCACAQMDRQSFLVANMISTVIL